MKQSSKRFTKELGKTVQDYVIAWQAVVDQAVIVVLFLALRTIILCQKI